ncbi:hypothetical protein [Tunturibacter empetritectus]|uniref:Uncharacterized protein n=1 Tax=Tunturiibacter lichenicola TaxID=2051959 RepID=A0A7W8N7L7_9BACT|nr:hypothetical protein [Edaphobacter lichenicola]MBB5346190.1 hypothetical protein [Edaphobacter lichenicola]
MSELLNPKVESSVRNSKNLEALLPYANVDTNATDAQRVATMDALLAVVVGRMDADPEVLKRAKRMLLLIAWHEGALLRTRVQGADGPARSFFQIECATAKNGFTSSALGAALKSEMAATVDSDVPTLTAAAAALTNTHDFPAGSLIKNWLEQVDIFGSYLARLILKKSADALPAPDSTFTREADYWYNVWNRGGAGNEGRKAVFIQHAKLLGSQLLRISLEGNTDFTTSLDEESLKRVTWSHLILIPPGSPTTPPIAFSFSSQKSFEFRGSASYYVEGKLVARLEVMLEVLAGSPTGLTLSTVEVPVGTKQVELIIDGEVLTRDEKLELTRVS